MRKILIIGIGAGNPDYMTVQAIDALNRADVLFIPDKGAEKAALRDLRRTICDRFIKDPNYRTVDFKIPPRDSASGYRAGVADWHAKLEAEYERLFTTELREGQCGAFLVWGDPTLYDSTLRIVERVRAKGFALDYDVIPGVTAVQALAAQHRVALNTIGEPVLVTTGRRIAEGFPDHLDSAVVMLDGEQAFNRLAADDLDIYWGAYLGTADEILISGKLSDVSAEIETTRKEARERMGWIMDTYLLRRRSKEP